MDQIQQNLVKLTNHKKKLGLFLVGIFKIREEHNKIKLENEEGTPRNCDQRGSWYQDDVGWELHRPIFHERSGSRDEHEEHEEGNEGKITRGTQENTQTNKYDHTEGNMP